MSVADYQNHNRVSSKRSTREASHLRKRNWGNCIVCVVLQIIWRLSVSVCFGESQAWIACVISYVLSTFFVDTKKSIKPFLFRPIPRPKVVEVLFPRADACEGSHISLRIWSVFSQGTWCVFSPLGTWRKKRRTYYRAATCEQGFRITLWNGETTWWCTKMHFTFYFKKVEHMNSFQHIGFLCIVYQGKLFSFFAIWVGPSVLGT